MGTIVLLTQFSISALNDWADRERDARVKQWRPLPRGTIKPVAAVFLAISLGLVAVIASFSFGLLASALVLAGLVAGWSYDLGLKTTVFSFVPFAVAFPLLPIWVTIVAGRPVFDASRVAACAAILAVSIHLADSLPDIASDSALGVRSLGVSLGADGSRFAILLTILSAAFIAAFGSKDPLVFRTISPLGVFAGVGAFVMADRHPESVRWIAAAFAAVAGTALLGSLRNA
jgi:4-hydroxybenzoate polyprenyltransferase